MPWAVSGRQPDPGGLVLDHPHLGLEHQVELTHLGQVVRAPLRALGPRLEVIGAVALLALAAVHQGIRESLGVSGSHPGARVHQDGRVQSHHVVAFLDDRPPPQVLDILLELRTQGAVVPTVGQASVDLRAGIDEAASLAERHDLVEQVFLDGGLHGDDSSGLV